MEKKRNFSLLFYKIFCYLLFCFHVKTGTRFLIRDKRLFEISEVEITGVDNICKIVSGSMYVFTIHLDNRHLIHVVDCESGMREMFNETLDIYNIP